MSMFRFIREEEFDEAVLRSAKPAMVWFSLPTCPPCKKIEPLAEKIAREYAGKINFFRVNVEENPALVERSKITSVPTFVFFKAGKEVARLDALPSREEFIEAIEKLV
jgi:thioredoxin 1